MVDHHLPTLYIYESDLNLPTPDPDCLIALTFLKFSKLKFKIANNPSSSPNDFIPLLKNGEKSIIGATNIIDYVKSKNIDIDSDARLDRSQKAETIAFRSLCEDKLLPTLIYFWWNVNENYEDVKKSLFKNTSIFLKFILSFLYRRKKLDKISNLGITEKEDFISRAKECLRALSIVLGKQNFFYGDRPTTLDAVVYGYLACFKYPDFKDDSLKQLLKGFPNLDTFCDRITENYFNSDYVPRFTLIPDIADKFGRFETEEEKSRSRTSKIIITLAGISIFAYIFYTIHPVIGALLAKSGLFGSTQGKRMFHRAEYVKDTDGNYSLLL